MKKSELNQSPTEKGQALVIVLLVMAVGLTMGLAVVSRSVTDIRISQQEEESARVFSAAEAGIEDAMISGPGDYTVGEGAGEITAYVTDEAQGGTQIYDLGGGKFLSGDTQTVWLVGHTVDGDLEPSVTFPATGWIDVCWGEAGTPPSDDSTPAIEATLIYQELSGAFKVARGAYDPYGGRPGGNEFDLADTAGNYCGSNLQFKKRINFGTGDFGDLSGATLYVLRLKLLYNGATAHPLALSGSEAFPSQGKCYVSTATFDESGVTRKIKQCQTYKAPPGIFDYVLFSGGNLVHQ